MENNIIVTILLPVYNAETFIDECIQSILGQTFESFELLIINDGSSDNSADIIKQYTDTRIRYIDHQQNRGLIATLNEGITMVETPFIARMDADDIALPNRLEEQIRYMEQNPDVGVCGAQMQLFGDSNERWELPVSHDEICASLLFKNKISHPTVVIRTSVLRDNNLDYSGPFEHLEDYLLWHKLKSVTRFHNLPKVLLKYRFEGQNITETNRHTEKERIIAITQYLGAEIGLNFTEEECLLHYYRFESGYIEVTKKNIRKLKNHFRKIMVANRTHSIYSEKELKKEVNRLWDLTFKSVVFQKKPLSVFYWWVGGRIKLWQIRLWLSVSLRSK